MHGFADTRSDTICKNTMEKNMNKILHAALSCIASIYIVSLPVYAATPMHYAAQDKSATQEGIPQEDDIETLKQFINNIMLSGSSAEVQNLVITDAYPVESEDIGLKGWTAMFLVVEFSDKNSGDIVANESMTLFQKGSVITDRLYNLKEWKNYGAILKPSLPENIYDKSHLVAGNENAEHKFVIFSDPLCPFCKKAFPSIYKKAKENPDKYALYYYTRIIENLHPASKWVAAAIEEERAKGNDGFLIDVYEKFDTDPKGNALNVHRDMLSKLKKTVSVKAMTKKENMDKIRYDALASLRCGITQVPSLFIDGTFAYSQAQLDEVFGENGKKRWR